MALTLDLVPIPGLPGIYSKPPGAPLPARMRWGHPDLAAALSAVETAGVALRFSDVFRSPSASLHRRREIAARGGPQLAKRPGESPHNWGLAVDVDVNHALKANGISKPILDEMLEACGLWCHRRDGQRGAEDWHYSCLSSASAVIAGPQAAREDAARWLASASPRSTSRAIEAKIASIYGPHWRLTPGEITAALAGLGYEGPEAARVAAFQRDWDLAVDGIAGPKTQRLLAIVTADSPAD